MEQSLCGIERNAICDARDHATSLARVQTDAGRAEKRRRVEPEFSSGEVRQFRRDRRRQWLMVPH